MLTICSLTQLLRLAFIVSFLIRFIDRYVAIKSLRMSRLPVVHPRHVKLKRTPRVTMRQLEALVARLEDNPSLHTKRGLENFESCWKKVADELNSIPNGSVKTPTQWITVWRDFKSRIYNKAANIDKEKMQSGDSEITLTNLEQKVIALRNRNYNCSTNCPDATPAESGDMIKNELEGGGNFPESQFFDFQLIVTETDEDDSVEVVQTTTSDSVAQKELPEASTSNRIRCNTPLQPPKPPIVRRTSTIASPSPVSETTETSVPELNLNPRQNIAEQRDSIRKELLTIVNSNAESMQMLAAATKVQAEASKMHAEVAKVQAETTLLLAQAINKTGDTLVNLINKN